MGQRRRLTASLAAFVTTTALVTAAPLATSASAATAPPRPISFANGHGLRVVEVAQATDRLYRLTVTSTALSQPVHVDVLLPTGYRAGGRYPTLYLFHGTGGSADDWIGSGGAVAASQAYPMILVIPDGGYDGNGGGWFTDWVDQHTPLGTANWEDFYVDQLVPFVDANLRTRADRGGRAVAGLSQGGYGAFVLAARHPDLFASAGSFSGAPDIAAGLLAKTGGTLVIGAVALGYDDVEPDAFFGNTALDAVTWRGHNPADLVGNLRDVDLNLWTGNGVPGHRDTFPTGLFGTPVEVLTETSTYSFADIATRARVPYRLDAYGDGTHSFPYWAHDLIRYLPRVAATFARPAPEPTTVSYTSIEKTWTQWGWTVANQRTADHAFSWLDSASRRGFVFTAGPAVVTTPAVYRAGTAYRVTVGSAVRTITADPAGRLTVRVSTSDPTRVVIG